MSVFGRFHSVLLSALLLTQAPVGFASEYIPTLKTKAQAFKYKQETTVNTGVLHINHYNADFSQSFYSIGLDSAQKALGGHLKAEAFGLFQVSGDGGSAFSIKNLYYTKALGKNSSIDLGRKVADWSYDERFKPAALWNNAWDYSKAFPETEGLFGLFVNFKPSKTTQAFVFASPLSIPKWVSHNDFDDRGGLDPKTPWFTAPPSEVTNSGTVYDTQYFLEADLVDVVLNPQIGFSLDYKSESTGLFSKASYLYGPDRDVDLAINFKLRTNDDSVPVALTISPEVSNVHRLGTEVGYRWSETSRTILSANFKFRDSALSVDEESAEQSYIGLSSGGVFQVLHDEVLFDGRVKMTAHFTENTKITSDANGELGPILLDSLSSPFRYNRGLGLNLDMKLSDKTFVSLYGYQDFLADGVLGSLSYNLQYKKVNLRAGISFVEALSADSTGFYRDFRENDSFYMGASYVF